jgi:broad specificity phosphatase PhoE
MARLYLITHAHTQIDPAQDAVTWQLSSAGMAQAERLAAHPFWATIDRIIVSSERKTSLTVAPLLAQRNLPITSERRFDEVHRPGWVDAYSERVRAFFASPGQSIGGWESADHALHRVLAGVAAHIAPDRSEQVALVSHGLVLSLYRAHLLAQWPPDFEAWRRLGFGAVAQVDLQHAQLIEDFSQGADGRGG